MIRIETEHTGTGLAIRAVEDRGDTLVVHAQHHEVLPELETGRAEVARLRRALERIRDYRPKGPVDEWSSAAGFTAVQELAADALNPGVRAERIRVDEAVRAMDRRRVGALQRGERYWLADMRPGAGAWVRFLRGDAERAGGAHVKVVEVVGQPLNDTLRLGADLDVYAGNLQAAPGKPLEPPR